MQMHMMAGTGCRSAASFSVAMLPLAVAAAVGGLAAAAPPFPSATTWSRAAWLNGSVGMIRTELPPDAVQAFVFASTIGFHELRFNGAVLGGGVDKLFEPGVGVYGLRSRVTSFNVTSLLETGNCFGALLGNGPSAICGNGQASACSDGAGTTAGAQCAAQGPDWPGPGGMADSRNGGCKAGAANGRAFRAVIALTFANRSTREIVTAADGSWQTAASPMLFDDMYLGERFDGRAAERTKGFWRAGYTGPTQKAVPTVLVKAGAANVYGGGVNRSAIMSEAVGPPMRVTKTYPAISVQAVPGSPGLWTYDFGTTLTGVGELALTGVPKTKPQTAAGAVMVTLSFAVMLVEGRAAQ